MLEKQIEDCKKVDGEKELSDAWTVCTRFVLLKEKPKLSGRDQGVRESTQMRELASGSIGSS